ncbi:ATPase [Trichormus variabilis ATCC 29413]|uniref:ATPase n=8 Tax=Anabaena variabilis TaxID=264691 RepID=Q3MEL7_TRIV2|nr:MULTISPECIES: AAA family ATPase [Nostocaceae]ABA20569.1 ATPase [Trichormus variabilis ATCC 29413]MBC1213992.1 AAA family ATPase [Trichormus variabilis ARAD]MBC1300788.1 AAA family ATPase [Trichormus variabilis N2B]MBC1312745.1 AAA family ATPase [Trichormus variabilis PNB]MBD2380527.1 AAA family ATPase [Trichormus variabilis FACHB-319]
MRIKQISVSGLFGIFDHVIPLNMDERITIIHGPNGFGKTAILRILNSFFNSRYSELIDIPFNIFRLEFNNNSSIEIIKYTKELENVDDSDIILKFYENDSKPVSVSLKPLYPYNTYKAVNTFRSARFDIEELEALVRTFQVSNEGTTSLERVKYNLIDVPPNPKLKSQEEPKWLENIKKYIRIRLIESQRLLNLSPNGSSNKYSMISTVSAYSDELAKLMQDKFQEYGKVSQSLDRTFPIRVVKQQPSADITDNQLRQNLNELEATRSRLIEVGLLDNDEDSEFQIQPQDIDESTKNALSVYIEDVEKKLSVFDDIASKIDLLKKIINNKFAYSYKEINFSKEKGFIFTTLYNSSSSNSKNLSPTDLSSGEQHELVLLYELLFKVQPNSLVLIDEPEISLHVGWQVQFLKDLQEITKLADLDILMATHSPDIIQDRWDLTVELKRPEK